jgi:4-hydroxy-tetrahydrodipicolinate synthase
VIHLSKDERIIAIKDASGGVENTIETLLGNPDFTVLSGDDCLFLPFLSVGAKGLISVASNVMPAKLVGVYNAWNDGSLEKARKEYFKLWPLFKAMFYESNPIPVKAALGLMEKIDPTPRLPLTLITPANLERLKTVLKKFGALP